MLMGTDFQSVPKTSARHLTDRKMYLRAAFVTRYIRGCAFGDNQMVFQLNPLDCLICSLALRYLVLSLQ